MSEAQNSDSGTPATRPAEPELAYLQGFANELESEALAGALPRGLNSPQAPPLGLYSELVSGSAFSAPRALNRRSYMFRIRPTAFAGAYQQLDPGLFLTPPLELPPHPEAMRWNPIRRSDFEGDFLDGLTTICGNGSPASASGMALHMFRATRSMVNRAFSNADGEFLIIPQDGDIRVITELGIIDATPSELVLVPRGIKFRVDLRGDFARGIVAENFGHPFILPDLGLIGSFGLANSLDFEHPVAAYENHDAPTQLVHKLAGRLWAAEIDHSPFDVVAWRGNLLPCKYDMRKFVAMGTATVDHPDPSIYCALTSPLHPVTGSNIDFMIVPPRWIVAEKTFRPPGFHRNGVAEIGGLVYGRLEHKAESDGGGSISLSNNFTPHGPDVQTVEAARKAPLAPQKVDGTLFFIFESRYPMGMSRTAWEMEERKRDFTAGWRQFPKIFPGQGR